jgi:sugar phosphate permease
MSLIGLGYGLSVFAAHYWQFVLLWGVIVGLGSGMAATVLGAAVSNRWFTTNRGLVMGMLTASTATGQLVFLPWLAWMVTTRGWRAAPLTVVAAAGVVLPVIWFFMRDSPSDVGLRPYGDDRGAPAAAGAAGNPARRAVVVLGQAIRVRDFWLLAGSFFICGASTNGLIGTHLVSAAFDCGIPEVNSASLLAMMGVFDLVGTTASGWLSDRFNSRHLLFIYYGLRGLSLLFLPRALLGPSAGLAVFAAFYGLDWVATVPPTVRLATEAFGRENAGIVFGWVVAAHQLGAASAALAAGVLRTTLGTYTLAFLAAGTLCLVASVLVMPIRRAVMLPQPAS